MTVRQKPMVLLTGAAQGIGRATAIALAAQGYRLSLIDIETQQDALQSVVETLRGAGRRVAAEMADVSDRDALREAVGRLESQVGPVDVAVACAGVGSLTSFHDLDMPGFRRMLEVNVLGVAHTIEAVLPRMVERKAGHIVGIASMAGYRGLPWMAGYCASKAAVATYLEGLRPILKRRGITITTVCPGFVKTGMTIRTPFRKPVKMLEPEQAARYVVRAIERRPRDFAFPPSAAIGMGLLRRLPSPLFDWMIDRAGPQALTTEF